MATAAPISDPLLALRAAVAQKAGPIATTSASPPDGSISPAPLSQATHLHFTRPNPQTFPLSTPTRFISSSSSQPVDLRSILFAYQKKDDAIPDYIASATQLNEALSGEGGAGGKVQNLVFVERLDLITWLEGTSQESEYIKPLEADVAAAAEAAQVAAGSAPGAAQGAGAVSAGAIPGARPTKTIDPRLQEIYNGERRMGDRNSILRGHKTTDFNGIRKIAQTTFLQRTRAKPTTNAPNIPNPSIPVSIPQTPSRPSSSGKSHRRPDPIILLSPSASSLLRLANIKAFLESGQYIPPNNLPTPSTAVSILHISRILPTIDSHRPTRFILTDDPLLFKPDYWSRVVAVFTTGQTWQFRGYKWSNPSELFNHAKGIYVGWGDEDIPQSVKGWGRGVLSVGVEKWREGDEESGRRWRDREVAERVWGALEEWMRGRGWGRER
ncbi:MAG: accessory factor associated with RNA polymerase II [Cirrosporium novae-zelandiae]|nr:MAG: accessory factor associated with RNA polymerase II [Cirrosporium novae-zelandiae]